MAKKYTQKVKIIPMIIAGLVVLSLALMIPLSLSSLNKQSTDARSQASGNRPYGIPDTSDRKWLYINTAANSVSPQTRWESQPITVSASQNYNLASAMVAFNLPNSGVTVSLICLDATCPRPDGNGTVLRDTAVETLSFNASTIGLNYYKRIVKTISFNSSFRALVRISAQGGTEAAIDYAKLSGLVPNGDFVNSTTRTIKRNRAATYPAPLGSGPEFVPPRSQLYQTYTNDEVNGNQFYGYTSVAPLNNDPVGQVVIRSFLSDQDSFDMRHKSVNYIYTFLKPAQAGRYSVIINGKLTKNQASKRVDSYMMQHSGLNVGTSNIQCPGLNEVSSNFRDYTVCTFDYDGSANNHGYSVHFKQPDGQELYIDSIKVVGPNNQIVQNSLLDSFDQETIDLPIRQPAEWLTGEANLNDYMSRWTSFGEY